MTLSQAFSANGGAAYIESCAAIGWNDCDKVRSLKYGTQDSTVVWLRERFSHYTMHYSHIMVLYLLYKIYNTNRTTELASLKVFIENKNRVGYHIFQYSYVGDDICSSWIMRVKYDTTHFNVCMSSAALWEIGFEKETDCKVYWQKYDNFF